VAALEALKISEKIGPLSQSGSAEHFHRLIEAMRLAFADARKFVADPEHVDVPNLLSDEFVSARADCFDAEAATADVQAGSPEHSSGTVYLCVVDCDGNACSFINSNYMGFGTGIIPAGCGFTLQNRGANFSTEEGHPNVIAPRKRPYHTIIPGMITSGEEGSRKLYAPFGVMGGFMQPQGHLQVVTNMIDFGMDPQEALDAVRFCILDGTVNDGEIILEEGVEENVVQRLRAMGHRVTLRSGLAERFDFGNGQIIRRAPNGVLWAGSDGRHDSHVAVE
jgi:gamma-glutamyltranspeptidase / glutathione hydrolase